MHDIMTIEEVAAYIRVSERTIYDWVQKHGLPGGKLGTTWRFKRSDIEQWVNERLSQEGGLVTPLRKVNTSSFTLTPERVILLEHGSKAEVLTKLVELLAETPFVKKRDELLKGILEREELMSTGIGFGIGVPHVRIDSVTDLVMAVAVCKEPISEYASLDGAPVQIVCMLAARSDQHTKYIRMLASISNRLKQAEARKTIIDSSSPAFICSQLIEE